MNGVTRHRQTFTTNLNQIVQTWFSEGPELTDKFNKTTFSLINPTLLKQGETNSFNGKVLFLLGMALGSYAILDTGYELGKFFVPHFNKTHPAAIIADGILTLIQNNDVVRKLRDDHYHLGSEKYIEGTATWPISASLVTASSLATGFLCNFLAIDAKKAALLTTLSGTLAGSAHILMGKGALVTAAAFAPMGNAIKDGMDRVMPFLGHVALKMGKAGLSTLVTICSHAIPGTARFSKLSAQYGCLVVGAGLLGYGITEFNKGRECRESFFIAQFDQFSINGQALNQTDQRSGKKIVTDGIKHTPIPSYPQDRKRMAKGVAQIVAGLGFLIAQTYVSSWMAREITI